MKKIAVYLDLALDAMAPLTKPSYIRSYFELSEIIAKLGSELFFVGNHETYLGDMSFSRSWKYSSDMDFIQSGRVSADIVFNRGNFIGNGITKTFNENYIDDICTDKWKTYKLLPSLSPRTFLAENEKELLEVIKKIETENIVVKPRYGSEGNGVVIGTEKDVFSEFSSISFPVIVQEFMDSSAGIDGIVEGTHDLRVALYNGEILYSYRRTPPPGSLKANVAQGGSFSMVNLDILPKELIQTVREIDSIFSHFPERFYGIDVALTPNGFKLIEMNSKLGLLPNSDAPEFIILKNKLAQTLTSA